MLGYYGFLFEQFDMAKITVQQKFKQSPKQIFAVFSKHKIYNSAFWPLQVERIVDAPNSQNPDDVGSIRSMGFGPIKPLQEEITVLEPNQLIEYQIVNNPLVKHHIGRLKFASNEQGTLLTYEVELETKLPLIALPILAGLKLGLKQGLAKIARQL